MAKLREFTVHDRTPCSAIIELGDLQIDFPAYSIRPARCAAGSRPQRQPVWTSPLVLQTPDIMPDLCRTFGVSGAD
jgi:hypothetical protein